MAPVDGSRPWHGSGNPFPPTAVASILVSQPEVLTIKTQAVRRVDDFIDRYLRAVQAGNRLPEPGDKPSELLTGTGRVCVIEGDYGSGKTHLAIEILNHIDAARATGDIDTRAFYRIAPGGNFLTLYTSLVKEAIGPNEVRARVREFYADIVAKALQERPYTQDLVKQLERGDVYPEEVIAYYGLKEGALRDDLRRRLSLVTEDETFSRALMLLLRPGIGDMAWEWLSGGYPSEILIEQGIAKRLTTDVQALDALGVIALLYGLKNRRFVLVIDELEKLAPWDRSDTGREQAFKRLLEVFHAAGALLVVCGLSDIFDILPRDPGRVDLTITPSPLSGEDVRWYIEETQQRAFDRRTLKPFTDESVDYLVSLTDGAARGIVRLCYYAFERASETGNEITPSDINAVARRRVPNGGVERVRAEVDDVLNEQAWPAERYVVIGRQPDTIADFWIPGAEPDTGCAIMLSGSILEGLHGQELAGQLAALRSTEPRRAVILVVDGYLSADVRTQLADAVGPSSLIMYNPGTFKKELARAVSAAVGPVTPVALVAQSLPSDEVLGLRAELERMARQQASTLRLVQDLAGRTEEQLAALQVSVDSTWRPAEQGPADPGDGLPAEINEMFTVAQRSLDAYGDIATFTDEAFAVAVQEPGATYSLTHRLREPDAFSGIGVAAYLSDLLRGFRASVRTWIGAVDPGGPSGTEVIATVERDRLRGICRTYDALYGAAPLYKLDFLSDVTAVAGNEPERASSTRSARREALHRAFDGLGDRVYQAALSQAVPPDRDSLSARYWRGGHAERMCLCSNRTF